MARHAATGGDLHRSARSGLLLSRRLLALWSKSRFCGRTRILFPGRGAASLISPLSLRGISAAQKWADLQKMRRVTAAPEAVAC